MLYIAYIHTCIYIMFVLYPHMLYSNVVHLVYFVKTRNLDIVTRPHSSSSKQSVTEQTENSSLSVSANIVQHRCGVAVILIQTC